jgi:hypothetical protein
LFVISPAKTCVYSSKFLASCIHKLEFKFSWSKFSLMPCNCLFPACWSFLFTRHLCTTRVVVIIYIHKLMLIRIWSYVSCIYNYLCYHCLSPLTLWARTPLRWGGFFGRCTLSVL